MPPAAPEAPRADRLRARDKSAFAAMIRQHERRLYNIGFAMTRNPEDARDILQETLLLAWRSIASLQDDTRLEAWLCRIATNSARMLLRSRRRKPVVSVDDVEGQFDASGHRVEQMQSWPVDPEDALSRARLSGLLGELALQLPDEYREVWMLADVEQMTMQEVAEVLELTVPNVKTRLHRARLALRRRMAEAILGARGLP